MSPTGSAPDGAAATIAALPAPGRAAVVVVLALVVVACLGAALAGLTRLLAVPPRRHGAARSTFYLAAMPTPLAAPGRHRHRRRSALVRWTAWPNPLSRDDPEQSGLDDALTLRAGRPRGAGGAHPAGREVTPGRALKRARARRGRAPVPAPAALGSSGRGPRSLGADEAWAAAPVPAGAPGSSAAPPRALQPPAARSGRGPSPQRRREVTPEHLAAQRRARADFTAASAPREVLRRLAERGLDATAAQACSVVLSLPTGHRIAAVADADWPTQTGADGWERRGCEPEEAAAAVGAWRRIVEGWQAASPPPWPWTGGGSVRAHLRDGDSARAGLAVPLRAGSRVLGAVLVTRAAGSAFTMSEEDVLGRIAGAAGERLAALGRGLTAAADGAAAGAGGSGGSGGEDVPAGGREELLRELGALLPAAALPGWAPVLVAVRLPDGVDAQLVADSLGPVLRRTDRVYRWADDELLVLLPDVSRARARAVAARVDACAGAAVRRASSGATRGPAVAWVAAENRSAAKLVRRARLAVAPASARTPEAAGTPEPVREVVEPQDPVPPARKRVPAVELPQQSARKRPQSARAKASRPTSGAANATEAGRTPEQAEPAGQAPEGAIPAPRVRPARRPATRPAKPSAR